MYIVDARKTREILLDRIEAFRKSGQLEIAAILEQDFFNIMCTEQFIYVENKNKYVSRLTAIIGDNYDN